MGETSNAAAKSRRPNWRDLPDELTAAILSRLGAVDILQSAQMVCTKWHKICNDPLFWRKIDMRNDVFDHYDAWHALDAMFRHLVHLSSGNVVDVNIEHFATYELFDFIAVSASTIRRLRLYCCDEISESEVIGMVAKLPMLEELEISLCAQITHEAVRAVGRCCPLLKSFKYNKEWCKLSDDEESESDDEEYGFNFDDMDEDEDGDFDFHMDGYYYNPPPLHNVARARPRKGKDDDVDALAIAETMQGLHHLQLYGNKLQDDGLEKILDCCPHLESLDLRRCLNLNMGGSLDMRCAQQVKRLWRPHDSTEGKGFSARSDGYCFKWTELPDEITFSILSRLGAVDILERAQKVCTKWRKICKDPRMWRTINMQNIGDRDLPYYLHKMCRHAIGRSGGNFVDVNVEHFVNDDLLEYITDSSLIGIRRLRLVGSWDISDEGLIEVAPKLPLLEDLDITSCGNLSHKCLEVLGRSCPLLKSFKFNQEWHTLNIYDEPLFDGDPPLSRDDDALAIARSMHGLYHLHIFGNQLTNDGLRALLDGCPHLESLDLRYCFNLDLEGDLGSRCRKQIKKLLLPKDSIADYGFSPSIESRDYVSCWERSYSPDYGPWGPWGSPY